MAIFKSIPMTKIWQRYKPVNFDKRWIFAVLIIWIISFFVNVWPILFLSIFCIGNSILLSIDRYIQAPLDLELSTFSAVLMTLRFDVKWGLAAAVMTKIAAIIYNKNIRADHVFMILGYVIAALIANIFPKGSSILIIGIIATIIVNIYVVFISKFVTQLSPYEIMAYGSSNTIFNIVLFIGFSELFMRLMLII